jgi:glycyl-tRNA synthetase alpha chain
MYLQGVENVYDLVYSRSVIDGVENIITYRDVWHQNEVEQATYSFEASDASVMLTMFNTFEAEAKRLMEAKLALPAYEMVLKAGNVFNLLDARGAISVTERAAYIGRIRTISKLVAQSYYDSRERLDFPMLKGATREPLLAQLPKKEVAA